MRQGIWILPLRGRVAGTKRLLDSVQRFDSEARVVALLDADDPDLQELISVIGAVKLPLVSCVLPGRKSTQEKINHAYRHHPLEATYGLLANDLELLEPDTLGRLERECPKMGLAYCDDGLQGETCATHPCVSGDLVRFLGWWAYPGCKHTHVDVVLMQMAAITGGLRYIEGLKMQHWHEHTREGSVDALFSQVLAWWEADNEGREHWEKRDLPDIMRLHGDYLREVRNGR